MNPLLKGKKSTSLAISPELLDKVASAATALNISRNHYINVAVLEKLRKDGRLAEGVTSEQYNV